MSAIALTLGSRRGGRDNVSGFFGFIKRQRDSHTTPHSRDSIRPRFANSFAPKKNRGRREDRVRAAPAVSCAKMRLAKTHTSIQVQRKQSGLPCAMVLQLISCSPRRDLACLPPSFLRSFLLRNLTPAIGASGPHDFAVRDRLRSSFANSASIASHRAFRDVRNAPLVGRDARNTQLIWVKNKAEYFLRRGWTGFRARR